MIDNITVVKIGGSTLGSADSTLADIALLTAAGERLVVVHGGGKEISRRLDEAGLIGDFVDGLRTTTEKALPVVVEALDAVNAELADRLVAAGAAVQCFSSQSSPLLARRIPALGRVGEVVAVQTEQIDEATKRGSVPVIVPLGRDSDGKGLLNVNADSAAGEIAVALRAGRLIFTTDVDGVRSRSGELLPLLHIDDAAVLLADGTAGRGMAPKLRACMQAAGAGIESTILDGRESGALRRVVFEGLAAGTRIGARATA